MDLFLPSSSSVGSSSPPSTEALMGQVKLQLAQAHAEEFLETVRAKCFAKCITKPGTSLVEVKVAASPGVWIVILKLQESFAEHSSVLHANAQPVILNPSRELQVSEAFDSQKSCMRDGHLHTISKTDLSCAAGEYTHLTHLHHCRSKIFSPYEGIGCILAHLIQSRCVGQECLVRCEQSAVQPNVLVIAGVHRIWGIGIHGHNQVTICAPLWTLLL